MARQQSTVIGGPVLEEEAVRAARVFHDTRERLAPEFGLAPHRAAAWADLPGAERALLAETCRQMILIGGWADGR